MLTVEDAAATEGDDVEFTVELSPASGKEVTVVWQAWAQRDDSAGADDFTAVSATTLTFAAGDTHKTVAVSTTEDTTGEANETFTLMLSRPMNAAALPGGSLSVRGTIVDDDLPALSVNEPSAIEGNPLVFEVTLMPASDKQVTVDWAAAALDAEGDTAGADDFTAASGTLIFAASETEKTVTVETADDGLDEADEETFTLTLSNASNATLATDTVKGTITDNDGTANAAPVFSSSAAFDAAENQTAVGRVVAADNDADDSVTGYAITGGADRYESDGTTERFEIDDEHGTLSFKSAPNFEDPQDSGNDNGYEVTVQATSGTGTRERTATQTITVTVTDVREKPAKPAKPTVTAVTGSTEPFQQSLSVTWQEPDLNGGPEITGYRVEYRKEPHGTWNRFSNDVADDSTTIDGLTAHTAYQVRVRARNGERDSDWSDPSDAVSTAGPTCTLDLGDIWCGVVTVEDTPFGDGYVSSITHPNISAPQVGGLSDRDFNVSMRSPSWPYTTLTTNGLWFCTPAAPRLGLSPN